MNFTGKGGPDLFSPELIKQTDRSTQNYQAPPSDLPLLPELPPARNPLFRDEDDEDVPEPIPAPPVPSNWSVLTRVLKTEAQDEVSISILTSLQLVLGRQKNLKTC